MQNDFSLCVCRFDKENIAQERLAAVLHPEELIKIEHCVMKRKAEFCAGRFCAKTAYIELSKNNLPFSSFKISNDSFGAPFLSDGNFNVTLAHDSTLAAAVVSKKAEIKVGIDLEKISKKNSEVIFKYIKDGEKELIRENENEFGFDFLCAAVWVARESMSKLLGLGFSAFPALETAGFENGKVFTVNFKNFKNFKTVIRVFENHVFGFSVSDNETQKFSKENLKIEPKNL